ncbi:metal-dependent hydrolase [compost metagenome]
MIVKWYGHSSFLLTSEDGLKVLIDPYGKFLGYRMPSLQADIVAVTHDHRDHNHVQVVEGGYVLVNEPRRYELEHAVIYGISTFHDNVGGRKRGENTVFVFEIDGLRLCHLGDLGHLPTAEQLEQIGRIDVLFVPVGGTRTLDGAYGAETVRLIKPQIAIPMHYRTEALGFAGKVLFHRVEPFIQESGLPVHRVHELNFTAENASDYLGIVLMEY